MNWYSILGGMLCIVFSSGSEEKFRTQWEAFKSTHGKRYKSDVEEVFRFKIFTENSLLVARHNEKYTEGLVSFKLRINKFGDLLHHEFVEIVNRYYRGMGSSELEASPGRKQVMSVVQQPAAPKNGSNLPSTVDWREKGAVTPVKNQGQCGSCWAFSAVGSIEGQHFRKTGQLVQLSEQNLVDCSAEYGNHGCKNGSIEYAYTYVMENGGIATESSYPYKALESTCKFKKEDVGAKIIGYVNIRAGSESDLQKAVANVGPLSAAIDTNHQSFQFYGGGLYDEPDCSSWNLTHGVLVVGYGEKDGKKYWLVKNSWSDQWGDNGFVFMSRDKGNQCGICSAASYPLV